MVDRKRSKDFRLSIKMTDQNHWHVEKQMRIKWTRDLPFSEVSQMDAKTIGYTPEVLRNGTYGKFEVDLKEVNGSPWAFEVQIEHRNWSESQWSEAGAILLENEDYGEFSVDLNEVNGSSKALEIQMEDRDWSKSLQWSAAGLSDHKGPIIAPGHYSVVLENLKEIVRLKLNQDGGKCVKLCIGKPEWTESPPESGNDNP